MNYLKIDKFDTANGEDIGVVLWVSGCDVRCPGCHNPETWDSNAGKLWDMYAERELFEALSKRYINRLTLTGGHPLMKCNRTEILDLISKVRRNFPHIQIWLYTGYVVEECTDTQVKEILRNCDVVVDGPFIQDLYQPDLPFVGSTNQRVLRKEDLFEKI